MSGHQDYGPLRDAQREAEAEKPEASQTRSPANPYQALHDTHRQVAEAEAAKPKTRTDAEWAEIALANDAALIRKMREEGKERSGDIGYKERQLALEPIDEKVRRAKYEEARAEEVAASRRYLESLKTSEPKTASEKSVKDAPQHRNEEVSERKAAQIRKILEEGRRFENEERARLATNTPGRGGRN